MRVTPRRALAAAAIAALLGFIVYWSGVVPIGAAGGHWRITDLVLHTAMRRSVAFHAPEEVPQGFGAAAQVRRGAGHFEQGCASCHGSPLRPRGAVPRAMVPEPPDLTGRVDDWTAGELYWIVANGVKFTGMPAWPAPDRHDEAWSLAAFLQRLPGMSREDYRALAFGKVEPDAPLPGPFAALLADCARCHGLDGVGDASGAFPRLDIQPRPVLRAALEAYAQGLAG